MTTPSSVEGMQTQAFEYVRQGQEAFTRLAGAVTETWTSMLRDGVGGAGGAGAPTGAIGAVPAGLPRPADVVDRSFDMGIQLLEAQRALAHGVLEAAAPVLRAGAARGR